jgi:CO/xanthine dehydrogenase FAD-binding subunit
MRPFSYLEPRALGDAVAMLAEAPSRTRLLAGGTDLLLQLERGPFDRVVNLKRIAGLRAIAEEPDETVIGPLATLTDLLRSEAIARRHPVLREAALLMASPQVRNLATIGGNLCNASPAADLAPPLLCLDARLSVVGPHGQREIPIAEFFAGPGRTALSPDEILVAIRVPAVATRAAFLKFSPRRAMDLAIVSVACAATNGRTRVALGAVAEVPLLVPPSPDEAASMARPIDDLRASAEYRRAMVRVLVRRALEAVARRTT